MIEFKGQTGKRHRFMVKFMEIKSTVFQGAHFALESAFPGPGVFPMLEKIESIAKNDPKASFLIIGHTDEKGSEDVNKKLSDRRAKAVLALLSKDLKMFDEVAEEDSWEVKHYQAMLRALGCNPGAIDNDDGDNTSAAVEFFQEDYNLDVFHSQKTAHVQEREHPDLKVDGVLGPNTKKALHDAYVSNSFAYIDPARFVDPKIIGCGEYNQNPDLDDRMQRSVVVACVYDKMPKLPCKEGDIGACKITEPEAPKCKIYRRHFGKISGSSPIEPFFDFQWLKEEDTGTVHISALTRIPDDIAVKFKICRWADELPSKMPTSLSRKAPPTDPEVIDELDGTISCGVAFARWTPPEGFDAFNYDAWYLPLNAKLSEEEEEEEEEDVSVYGDVELYEGEIADPTEEEIVTFSSEWSRMTEIGVEQYLEEVSAKLQEVSPDKEADKVVYPDETQNGDEFSLHPPVFIVAAQNDQKEWAASDPPGIPFNRIHVETEEGDGGLVLTNRGTVIPWEYMDGKPALPEATRSDIKVIGMLSGRGTFSEENEDEGEEAEE